MPTTDYSLMRRYKTFLKDLLDNITHGTAAAAKVVILDANKAIDAVRTAALYLGASGSETLVNATALEINRACDVSARQVAAGATLTATVAAHDGKTILLDTAAGSVVTMPTAAGTGARIRFLVSVTATSNSHVIQAGAAADIFYGSLTGCDVDTADATLQWAAEAADAFDTITLNRTTTGIAAIGDWIEFEDVGTNKWAVRGNIRQSGTVATPFTSAV